MPKTRLRQECVSMGGREKIDRYVRLRCLDGDRYAPFNPGGRRRVSGWGGLTNRLPLPKGGVGEEVVP